MSGFSADIGDNIYYSDSPKLKKAKVNHLLCKKTHNPSYFQKISKHFLSKGKYLHLKLTRQTSGSLAGHCLCRSWVHDHCSIETVCSHLASCVEDPVGQWDSQRTKEAENSWAVVLDRYCGRISAIKLFYEKSTFSGRRPQLFAQK